MNTKFTIDSSFIEMVSYYKRTYTTKWNIKIQLK